MYQLLVVFSAAPLIMVTMKYAWASMGGHIALHNRTKAKGRTERQRLQLSSTWRAWDVNDCWWQRRCSFVRRKIV